MSSKRKVAYLDWAGVPGESAATRTADWLVVAVAVVAQPPALESGFRTLCARLKLPPSFEFHFVNTPDWIRVEFFQAARGWNFDAAAIVVKKLHNGQAKPKQGVRMLGQATASLTERFPPERLERSLLIVDAPNDNMPEVREISNRIRRVLRLASLTGGIRTRGRPAHQFDGLQLADMLAGGVLRREAAGEDYVSPLGEKLRVFWK